MGAITVSPIHQKEGLEKQNLITKKAPTAGPIITLYLCILLNQAQGYTLQLIYYDANESVK